MNEVRADLHTHTHHSDGQLAPMPLVQKARAQGLHALAVTDHDTVEGYEEAAAAGRACGVEVVPGVELSVTVGPREVHLLGYLFDPAHEALRQHLEGFHEARRQRARRMAERLTDLGRPLSFEAVQAQAEEGAALGRPHVAAALVAAGHVATQQRAFEDYIADGGPAFVAKPRFPAEEALAMLHDAGGLGVLAHPGQWTPDALVMQLIRAGLDGLEVVHPSHDATLTRYYGRLARDFNLLETGGSDYHGHRAYDDERFGAYTVPYARVEQMRQRAARRRTEARQSRSPTARNQNI